MGSEFLWFPVAGLACGASLPHCMAFSGAPKPTYVDIKEIIVPFLPDFV